MKILFSLLIVLICSFTLRSADDSLLLHLKFDEGKGNILKDHSGKGHDAKLINGKWEKFGVRGTAVELNGKNAYVDIPWSKDLDLAEEFTYSIWFKMFKNRWGMNLFARGNYSIGFQNYVYDSFVSFTCTKVKGKSLIYTNFVYATRPESPYYHLVVTSTKGEKQGERILRFYVNGKQRANAQRFGGEKDLKLIGLLPVNRKLNTTIGKYSSHEGQWFKGIIDEAKIYNRPLTAEEIEKEYKTLSVPDMKADVQKKKLKKVVLPPLKKKSAAIYIPDMKRGQSPFQKVEWLEEQLKKAGVTSKRLSDKDLAKLPSSQFQTLIMPYNVMALEGEDAVFKFLQKGGNVIAASCMATVYNPLYPKESAKYHSRGWYAPFLIRKLDAGWQWARRNAKIPLSISEEAAALAGDLLPPSFTHPRLTFTGIDRWNVIKGSDGGYGDGTNYILAADMTLPLYKEFVGSDSDFILYRYFNAKIMGSTFTNVGEIGTHLLKSPKGADVFKALLHLQEMKFPGEQSRKYYDDLKTLYHLWGDFSWEYIALAAKIRDGAFMAYQEKKDYKKEIRNLNKMNDLFIKLQKDHNQLKQYLAGKAEPGKIAAAVQKLIKELHAARKSFAQWEKNADTLLKNAKAPSKVPVKHRYGTLQLIASLTLPVNLNRFRGDLFDEMKRMGVTVYSGTEHPWYILDPIANAKRKQFKRDHKFTYAAEAGRIVRMGTFNPVDGSVKDGKKYPFPYSVFHKTLKERFATYDKAGIRQFRIGTGDETGLGYSYWGTPAQKEFQEALKKYYKNDIKKLNAHCLANYKSFDQIPLPRKQPSTPGEHALWEHWRNCREAKLEGIYEIFYKEIKKLKKDLDVFTMPSTGGMESPLYGINFYDISKYCDVNAIDGTTTSTAREWIFNDLTRKQVLTSEWGGTYADVNEQRLQGMLWKELSGGMTGAELHVYSWGSDSISFLDILDGKNVRGASIAQFMKEIRTLDHVLLDGKRKEGEIGILFSQTSRMHDQNWGMNGQKTYSPHVAAVSNYYALFLTTQRNARVIAEEKILEEDVPSSIKFLILPQTRFLTEKLQKKLLAYVRRGGIIFTEGRAGQFDAFGMPSDLLFRECGVIPAFTSAEKFTASALSGKIPEDDKVFSPSGKGKILAKYDTNEPAILMVPSGKGKIIISGLNSGLSLYPDLPALTEEILRQQKITPRFIVSDPSVILREWVHGKDTYIILTQVRSDTLIKEIQVKIRGKVKVEDYNFGKSVKTKYEKGYTLFSTLTANGGRTFLIKGDSPASLPCKAAEKIDREFSAGKGRNISDVKNITLPFTGRLFDETPFSWNGYTFTLATISAGVDDKKGESFLTISKGREKIKKRFLQNVDTYFVFKDHIFKVRSSRNFYKYPFHSDLKIETVKVLPRSGAVKGRKQGNSYLLENDMIQCRFLLNNGAAISSLLLKDRYADQIGKDSNASSAAFVVSGSVPGLFWGKSFLAKNKVLPDKSLESIFTLSAPVNGKTITEKFRMKKEEAGFSVDLTYTKLDDKNSRDDFRWHPELAIGGSMETGDAVFYPGKNGTVKIPLRGIGSGQYLPATGNWTALMDTNDLLGCVFSFENTKAQRPYIWDAAKFHTVELENKKFSLKKGEKKQFSFGMHFVRGLEGMDAWNSHTAVLIKTPAVMDQKKFSALEIKGGTSLLQLQKISFRPVIKNKAGKIVSSFPARQGNMIYEMPFTAVFKTDFQALSDGEYTIFLTCKRNDEKSFTVSKKITFAGEKLALLRKRYENLVKKVDARKDQTSRKTYEMRITLESLRRNLALAEIETAEKVMEELEKRK